MIIHVIDFETVLRNCCSSGDWTQTLNEIQDAPFLHYFLHYRNEDDRKPIFSSEDRLECTNPCFSTTFIKGIA